MLKDKNHFLNKIPLLPGVYLFKNSKGEIIYIGKSNSLRNRLASYFKGVTDVKTSSLVKKASTLSFVTVENEFDALILEANLIKKHQPKYNIELKDAKFYPYLKITIKEKIPRVLITRQIENDGNLYFGPYVDARGMYYLLKTLRKIFPFCLHKNPYKSCLYIHLGLCPFPYEKISAKDYQKNINLISQILSGKKTKVNAFLQKELKLAIKNEQYEIAGVLNRQIELLKRRSGFTTGLNDAQNASSDTDKLHQEELEKLIVILKEAGLKVQNLERIECFDISNIQGANATASMVVLTNGVPDKSQYRRFRIRSASTPNDYAMLNEAVSRRLEHKEWVFPDLIVIDGGLGQLRASIEAMERAKLTIPCLGLAKRLEIIHLPSSKQISLNHDNKALHPLQRIRDEAHRFALKYHRLLRSKALLRK